MSEVHGRIEMRYNQDGSADLLSHTVHPVVYGANDCRWQKETTRLKHYTASEVQGKVSPLAQPQGVARDSVLACSLSSGYTRRACCKA